ncbi:PAS domain-containing protein [Mucilaginibacter sp. X5P1]|uniref:PAS domain-containing protein n=1 Tax=Mucilaginibacter sp. X5P1 TaxID=2723088 RepID=UPI0016185FF9|nr:PAS domain-containing protein [Mucilaginibacter sp. X5P1]MBB6142025.1 PAS domain S-box-containing protein [Mucilaginibacter sp. X5P1]
MFDSTLMLSRIGIILNIDADFNDHLFERGVDYTCKNFTTLFNASQTELLKNFLDKVFTTEKLQCIEFSQGSSFYQLKCIVTSPGHAVCIVTNNTRHLDAVMELENHNMKTLVDIYIDWVWSFDTNFTLVTANKAFLEARRRSNNKVLSIGDNIFKHVDDKMCKKWMPVYERALSGELIHLEEKRDNNGVEYYVEIYISPVYNKQNKIIGCLGITRDITERKHAQLAIAGYTSKLEEFAFKTSHDLRRPVANIMGVANLLCTADLDEEEKAKAINYIAVSINELDSIVISMTEIIQLSQK